MTSDQPRSDVLAGLFLVIKIQLKVSNNHFPALLPYFFLYIIWARRVISQAHRLLIDNWVCLPLPLSALLCTLFLHFHSHYLVIQKVRQPLLPKRNANLQSMYLSLATTCNIKMPKTITIQSNYYHYCQRCIKQ